MKAIEKFFEQYADRLVWIGIFFYSLIFGILCTLKYFSFGYFDWDFASDIIVLWNSIHGRFLYYPFLEQNIFGAHLYFILLAIIPLYALIQHPLTILFLQTLFLGLGAYPLYLLAKTRLNKLFALAITFAYLLYPSLGFINLYETHFEIYEIFFLFFALFYFEKKDFKKYLLFIILALMCKENASLAIFMLGPYALLRKRSKDWVLVPSLLALAWFLVSVKLLIPLFAKDAKLYQGGFIFSIYYEHLGRSIPEMMKTIFLHPVWVARFVFVPAKLLYLFQLFVPTAFMGVLSPAVLLMTVPIFLQNLLSAAPTHSQIQYQYVALLIPFIFASVIGAFQKLLRYSKIYAYRSIVLIIFLIISIVSGIFLKAPQLFFVRHIKEFKITDVAKQKEEFVRLIPKEAAVMATFQFLPRLANRFNLYSLHFVTTGHKMYTMTPYIPPSDLEYALIDFNDPFLLLSFFPPDAPERLRFFLKDGHWKVLRVFDDVVLFKKNGPDDHNLLEVVSEEPRIENVLEANLNDQIMFLGYNVIREDSTQGKILHLVYFWKRLSEQQVPLGFILDFLDSDYFSAFQKFHTVGYRIYDPSSWPMGQVITEHHYILIPSHLRQSVYTIIAAVFRLDNGMFLPVTKTARTDAFGRLILGDVSLKS